MTNAPDVLQPHHRRMLIEGSAILPEVIEERGYCSETVKARLHEKGFGRAQQLVPGMLIPIHGVTGNIEMYQHRPDSPRTKKGKKIKYETPFGSRLVLDVPPRVLPHLGDPNQPLFFTEGSKKADSIVSQGGRALGLMGVYGFRGQNEWGGKTLLTDFESVALNDRQFFLAFDSDAMTKFEVYRALERFSALLKRRDARVSVVYFPDGPNGEKWGADDFLAAGHTLDDLRDLAEPRLRVPPDLVLPRYEATPAGMIWRKQTKDGPVEVPLSNFTARIVADVTEDDGVETRRFFEVEVDL